MTRVCICFSGFLETQEHSFICNCHLQLIIAWYVLYINSVTCYTHSSELRLSAGVSATAGSISQGTLASLFSPKTAREMYTNTKSQHVCACIPAYSALLQGYTAQTCTTLASNSPTAARLSGMFFVTKEEESTQAGIRTCVSVHWHKLVSECWQGLGQPCKDTQPPEPFWCIGTESRSKLSTFEYTLCAGGVP